MANSERKMQTNHSFCTNAESIQGSELSHNLGVSKGQTPRVESSSSEATLGYLGQSENEKESYFKKYKAEIQYETHEGKHYCL